MVRQFTVESARYGPAGIPDGPRNFGYTDVEFIVKMVMDELMELFATVAEPEHAKLAMIEMIMKSDDLPRKIYPIGGIGNDRQTEDQIDALVDIQYYIENAAVKKGINLYPFFKLVHEANMAKKDPLTGKFLHREEDGKVIKPIGWQAPSFLGEIERQQRDGAFEKVDEEFHEG